MPSEQNNKTDCSDQQCHGAAMATGYYDAPYAGHGFAQAAQPVRIITQIIFVEKPTQLADVIPFAVAFFIYGLITQMGFSLWKRLHEQSHKLFQLAVVVGFPPFILYVAGDYSLFVLWIAYVLVVGTCLRQVCFRPMSYDVPRQIYRVFRYLFLLSNMAILLFHVLLAGSFFLYRPLILLSLRLLLYSIYLAVLSRELILNLSQILAARAGYFSKEGIPVVRESGDVCMLCTGRLGGDRGTTGRSAGGDAMGAADGPAGSGAIQPIQTVRTLHCGHSYHDECIRGWALIGQNRFCPYCKKGIEASLFSMELWERTELPFKPLMNLVRSFISFFVVLSGMVLLRMR